MPHSCHPQKHVLALGAFLSSCGVPIQVERVTDPRQEVSGIRYMLKRPAFSVAMQVYDPNRIIEAKVLNPKRYCISDGTAPVFQVVVTQDLTGKPETFEVDTTPRNLFANTDFSVAVDENGFRTTISAGATDQILPFVTAVAGLKVGLATRSVLDSQTGCLDIKLGLKPADAERFDNYIQRHGKLKDRRSALSLRITDMDAKLKTERNPGQVKLILDNISSLEKMTSSNQEALKVVGFKVPKTKYELTVDGELVVQGQDAWFSLTLSIEGDGASNDAK